MQRITHWIKKYLANETLAVDQRLVEVWSSSGDKSDENSISFTECPEVVDRMQLEVKNRPRYPKSFPLRFGLPFIACFFMFIPTLLILKKRISPYERPARVMTADLRVYESGIAEWKQIVLPDQSLVTLMPNSQVSVYLGSYGKLDREVELVRGEVLVKVQPNQDLPFMVFSDAIRVKSFSGSFICSSYPELMSQQVESYQKGVEVQQAMGHYKILAPGDRLIIQQDAPHFELFSVKKSKIANDQAMQGQREFFQISFKMLAVYCHDHFAVELKAANPIIEKRYFDGVLKQNDSVDQFLAQVFTEKGLQIRKQDDYYLVF